MNSSDFDLQAAFLIKVCSRDQLIKLRDKLNTAINNSYEKELTEQRNTLGAAESALIFCTANKTKSTLEFIIDKIKSIKNSPYHHLEWTETLKRLEGKIK